MPAGNCDIVPITLSGSGGAYVAIDGKVLTPSPFVSMQVEKYKMDAIVIGGLLRVTLSGTIVGSSFDDTTSELVSILSKAQKSDCINIVINCANTFIDGYGRITDLSFDQGNQPSWINLIPYSVTIEVYENDGQIIVHPDSTLINASGSVPNNCLLYNMSEQISLSVNEDGFNWGTVDGSSIYFGNRHIKASFSISAAGINGGCGGSYEYGLQAAETVIVNRLDKLKNLKFSELHTENNLVSYLQSDLDSYVGGYSYLEFRSVEVNTLANSISINGDIIYRPNCSNHDVFTEITVEENLENDGATITINGTITGLVDSSYAGLIDNNDINANCYWKVKIDRAETFLNLLTASNYDILYDIANAHLTNDYLQDTCVYSTGVDPTDICPLPSGSPIPSPELCTLRLISSQISRDPSAGSISFTFIFNNKQNCSIPGTKRVDIEINHDIPHDNVVEILIPGRGASGPITQSLCVKSSEKYTISINAVLNTSRCNWKNLTEIDPIVVCASGLLSDTEDDLGIDCWFVTDHQETKGNNTYKLTKSYLKPSCV